MRSQKLYRSIKKFRNRQKDRRGKHKKKDRLERIRTVKNAMFYSPICRSCHAEMDPNIKTFEGDAIVCRSCGVVDDMQCYDFEPPPNVWDRNSPLYMHKNYFAEKLLQARNKEPRFTEKELDVMSMVYDIFRTTCPILWAEHNFTKKHCAKICRIISKHYPKSPFCRRVERWYQFRTYICGPSGYELTAEVANNLRTLFDAYAYFFSIYQKRQGKSKRNITQLDLVIIVLLYNLGYEKINCYGWYFLNHNIVNKTPSIVKDRNVIKEITENINKDILKFEYQTNQIKPECYGWFREGNVLRVPSLNTLISMCMYNSLGVIQYMNYKKNNEGMLAQFLEEKNW